MKKDIYIIYLFIYTYQKDYIKFAHVFEKKEKLVIYLLS